MYRNMITLTLLCVAIYANPAHADSLQFCSPTSASSQSVAGASGYTTTVSSTSALKSGACSSVPPPPPSSKCKPGLPADLPGITALCAGSFKRHVSGPTQTPDNGTWTFDFVFGAWAGAIHNGWDAIFNVGSGHYMAISFTPSPGHSVAFRINTTYTLSRQDIFAISKKQGVFLDGPDTVCNSATNPNLTTSSNGTPGVLCKLDAGTTYWLNMVPGTGKPRQPLSPATFVPCAPDYCIVAVQVQSQN
jgi:hypothetical protein